MGRNVKVHCTLLANVFYSMYTMVSLNKRVARMRFIQLVGASHIGKGNSKATLTACFSLLVDVSCHVPVAHVDTV